MFWWKSCAKTQQKCNDVPSFQKKNICRTCWRDFETKGRKIQQNFEEMLVQWFNCFSGSLTFPIMWSMYYTFFHFSDFTFFYKMLNISAHMSQINNPFKAEKCIGLLWTYTKENLILTSIEFCIENLLCGLILTRDKNSCFT